MRLLATHLLSSLNFTIGREFFVGLSKRTNQRGAEILADTFKVGRPSVLHRINDLNNIYMPLKQPGLSNGI